MSKLKDLNLNQILSKVNIKFKLVDINRFCTNVELEKKISEAIQNRSEDINQILLENEKDIDIDKLLFVSWLNYNEQLKKLEAKKNDLKNKKLYFSGNTIEKEIIECNQNMHSIKQVIKGKKIYLVRVNINKIGKIVGTEIIASEEIINNANLNNIEKKNKKIFDDINKTMSAKDEENIGMNYVLQILEIEDLEDAMPLEIARAIEYKVENETKRTCAKEIEKLKEKISKKQDDDDESRQLDNYIRENSIIPEIRKGIGDVLKYIDIQKVLLINVRGFEKTLENELKKYGEISKDDVRSIYVIVNQVMQYLNKDTKITEGEFPYSYSDAEALIRRIDEETLEYTSKEDVEKIKDFIVQGGNIGNLDVEEIKALNMIQITKDELEEIMKTSEENYAFGIVLLDLSEDKILEYAKTSGDNWSDTLTKHLYQENKITVDSVIELYYLGKINPEFFKEFIEETKISSKINLQTINNLYINSKKEKDNEDIKNKLNKQIELYKVLNLDEKEKEELEEASEDLIYELAENFDKDNQDLMFYYNNGLITLSTVAQWAGDSEIEKLYQESTIQMQDIEDLYNNGFIKQKTIEKIILDSKPEYAELLAYIFLGYISEETIEKMYMEGRIFDETLSDMFKEGIVPPNKYLKLIEKRSREVLEKHAKIKLEPILYNIPDEKIKMNVIDEKEIDSTYHYGKNKKIKEIIHPEARRELLKRLGAMQAKAEIEDSNNAFYNYEFFVIPNERGELESNSVVIAERFYKDKELEDELATENATYFFQYKDLMVNSNLSKKEMMEDKKNIVFTSNHRIGSWAVSVLYRVAQTRASSDFKDYKKGDERATRVIDELRKMYTDKQIESILKQVKEIDDDQLYTYEEVNSTFSKTSTDDEQR